MATVEGVWCVIVPRGKVRLAAIQVHFKGGAVRDYLLYYRSGTGGIAGKRPAESDVKSMPKALARPFDLRKRGDAKELLADLEALDLTGLVPSPREHGRSN
jgi:hypothetical protein